MSRNQTHKLKRPLWLNWEGTGYFGVPDTPIIPFPRDPRADPTLSWVSAFQHARRCDFRYVVEVTQLVNYEREDVPYNTCADLLGDAGPTTIFPGLLTFIKQRHWNFELTYAWCRALALRGRLADIPAMIDAYEANINSVDHDNDIILMRIAEVIDDGDIPQFSGLEGFRDLEHYRWSVNERCELLGKRFGGEDVLLWRGEPTSVRRMAEHIIKIAQAEITYLPSWTRHRFEASTGINCTEMFDRRGNFRPLQAAAIAEQFLDDPGMKRYVDGERYFFGHRVP